MTDTTPSKTFIQFKIFGEVAQNDEAVGEEIQAFEDRDSNRPKGKTRGESAYVTVFEKMVNDVLPSESCLFSQTELDALEAFSRLCYNSRYCLIRLLLLKPKQWYPLSAFERWKQEVGEDGILLSIEPLCQSISQLLAYTPPAATKQETEEKDPLPDIIDLTADSDDEDVKPRIEDLEQPIPGPSTAHIQVKPEDPIDSIIKNVRPELNLDHFCESDKDMTLKELLSRMTVDQLKTLAKQNKCTLEKGTKKAGIVYALLNNAMSQTILDFGKKDVKGKGKARDAVPSRQTTLSFQPKISSSKKCQSQERRLRDQALKVLGRCFRVNPDFFLLVRRLNIIAYRCTEHPTRLMLPALLTKFKRRAYPKYEHNRDPEIWPTRVELLKYEEALELEMLLDEIIDAKPEELRQATIPPRARATPATPGARRTTMETPMKTPRNASRTLKTPSSVKQELNDPCAIEPDNDDGDPEPDEPEDTPQIQKAKKIAQYLEDWIIYRWRVYVEMKMQLHAKRSPALQRFEPGYVYSRMLRKAQKSLATLKDYQRELDIINIMLGQRAFLRGKRAKLYERRAVLQTRYLCKTEDRKGDDMAVLRQALDGVREALLDEDTVLVARPSILRRLRRLEKRLKVPPEECAVCEGELRKAETVVITAKRIFHRETSIKLDNMGKPMTNKENIPSIANYLNLNKPGGSITPNETQADPLPDPVWFRRKGKSIWEGRNSEEVTVEQRALQHYEDLGFKGFHAETSILTTIFALLFWDIIFANVRGAFETEYQSAPLDIVDSDSFYFARKELIEARLEELRQGKGVEILQRHYALYGKDNTWCIGVRWDICGEQDLVDILQGLGGKQIASVCKLFCEDYTGRCSGGPDLIAWNVEHRICKFIEVKGPGDTPQENQRLWFDSLLAAGIDVEICKVVDINDVKDSTISKGKSAAPATRKRKRSSNATKAKRSGSDSEMEAEADYDKMGPESEEDLPQAAEICPKRNRVTEPEQMEGVS
ncbi:hypothetical protein FA15DRAFT_696981 [Coprinopsis marcescibilis]|uniref:Fanconi-associated nuclease n=1 Tax=Coprinopsis marcescibilis TaxID=230819 RepID=A0A5C3KKA7_COPMA|nr:hypothetical protein FA15DRAFT_696981 [Coprinopsis marcescibilis]